MIYRFYILLGIIALFTACENPDDAITNTGQSDDIVLRTSIVDDNGNEAIFMTAIEEDMVRDDIVNLDRFTSLGSILNNDNADCNISTGRNCISGLADLVGTRYVLIRDISVGVRRRIWDFNNQIVKFDNKVADNYDFFSYDETTTPPTITQIPDIDTFTDAVILVRPKDGIRIAFRLEGRLFNFFESGEFRERLLAFALNNNDN